VVSAIDDLDRGASGRPAVSERSGRLVGADVAVDGHGGDAAGGGDLGHGELAGVVHSLSFADEVVRHFRFAAAFVAAAAGGDESGLGALAG
jgi:hypothetical protein